MSSMWLTALKGGCTWLDRATFWLSAALLAFMSAIVFAELVARYVFNYSFTWIEELARYLLVWLTMIIGSSAIWRAELVGMAAIVQRLPERLREAVVTVTYLMIGSFLIMLIYYGIGMVEKGAVLRSPSLQVSMSWFYLAIPVGSALMLIQVIGALFRCNRDIAPLPSKDAGDLETH